MSRSWRSASGISAPSGCARSRGIWKTKSARHPRRCKSASIVSAESLGSGRLPGAPSTGSLICITRRNCGICKWSRMFAGTQPRRHASRSRGPQVRRVMYHRAKVSELPFGSKVTTRTGVLLREKDTGKLRAAPRCHRNPKASRHRLRDKEENCAEPECQCPPPALTPHQPKKPLRGGVCLARKTGRYICHVPHLREDSPTNCQRVGKASEGVQLVWQTA